MSGLELVTASSTLDNLSPKTVLALCPVGKKAVGGGAEIVSADEDLALSVSKPTGGSLLTGWTATAVETDAVTTPWSLTVYAICATA